MLSDIIIFEEESNEDYEFFLDDGQISDNGSSENEDQEGPTAHGWECNITRKSFSKQAHKKKTLTQRAGIDATPDCEMDTFKLFYRPGIIFLAILETYRKARDVRHQHGLLPNSIY